MGLVAQREPAVLVTDFLLLLIIDAVGGVTLGILFEFTKAFDSHDSPAQGAILWFLVLGLFVGACTIIVAPHRLLPAPPRTGVSLLVVPLLLGGLLELFGRFRNSRRQRRSHLATWYGGMALGGGAAAGRLVALLFVLEVKAVPA